MFLVENARSQCMWVVGGKDGDGALQDDGAVVELLVDEMDGAAGDLDAVFEGLGLRVEAGKGGQQRGMDVEDALREGLDESGESRRM